MAHRRLARLLALLVALTLVAAACGDDEDEEDGGGRATEGGELVDVATFAAGAPASVDPALTDNVEAYNVTNALYDGLTDIDSSDPENPEVVGLVAEEFESNDDATEWTFTIRDGVEFSNGEAVLPSSFVRAWERASDPDLAGSYASLFGLIEGGQAKLDGEADSITGLAADDDAMTLTVTLAQPYADFATVVSFYLFSPMPKAVEELDDQSTWDRGVMIGNGPFKLEGARSDREIVLVRNDNWAGNFRGLDEAQLAKVTFQVSSDADSAFSSFEAGEAQVGPLPRAEAESAAEQYGTTLDTELLNSFHFQIAWEDPMLGGEDNVELRKAISLAIDRDEVNDAAYNGTQAVATGIVPPGIPGFERGLCKYCEYDPAAAEDAFEKWKAAGNSLDGPVTLQVNAGSGHEPALQVMVDHLKAIGIDATFEAPPQEDYGALLGGGGCKVCRFNWVADYPTYDNFLKSMFYSAVAGAGPNWGLYKSDRFDGLVDAAIGTSDAGERGELFREAEGVLLNDDVAVIPMFWGRGTYVYDKDRVEDFEQTPFGVVLWEQVGLSDS